MLRRASWHEAVMYLPMVPCKHVCGGLRRHSAMLLHQVPFASLFLVCFACMYAPDSSGELSCTHVPQCGVEWGCQLPGQTGFFLSAVCMYTLRTVFEVGYYRWFLRGVCIQAKHCMLPVHWYGKVPHYVCKACAWLCSAPTRRQPEVVCETPFCTLLCCVCRRSGTVA
jgi:hypothetical protein